jgi:uncharacterized membrane protein YeaQ/YmgE (transglycosylase-associated protein family)
MPNGETHRKLGAVAGGGAALYYAREQLPRGALVEVIGGVTGGVVGGMLPDRFDPPTSPNHRGAYHSVLLLLVLALVGLETQRRACRERAHQAMRMGATGLEDTLASDVWLFAAGFITGVQWGYLSHLGADLVTGKTGLPFVLRGF